MKALILFSLMALTPIALAQPSLNATPIKLDCPGTVGAVAFSPDGRFLVAGTRLDNKTLVRIWSTTDLKVVADLTAGGKRTPYITRLEFSPDGKFIATASSENDVAVWTIDSPSTLRKILHMGKSPKSLSFTKDSTKLVVASEDEVVSCDLKSGKSVTLTREPNTFRGFVDAVFSPTTDSLFVFRRDAVEQWDVEDKKIVKAWKTPHKDNWFGVISADGKYLISGGGAVFGHKVIEIWNTGGLKVGELAGFRGGMFELAISRSTRFFAVAGGNYHEQGGMLSVWDFNNPPMPDAKDLLLGKMNPWTLNTPQEIGFVSHGDGPVDDLTFSPDDKLLAVTTGDWYVLLYDVNQIRGPRRESRDYALCGEIVKEDDKYYIVPLSKVPKSDRFEHVWQREIVNPTAMLKDLRGFPVSLGDWEYEIRAGSVKIKVNEFRPLLPSPKSRAPLDYIVFGNVKNPGWDQGLIAKIYEDGTYIVVNNTGQCFAQGQLAELKTDFSSVRNRLINRGLLSLAKDPLVPGYNHFNLRFIEIRTNGVAELRTDAGQFISEKAKRVEEIYTQEDSFINTLRNAGLSRPN